MSFHVVSQQWSGNVTHLIPKLLPQFYMLVSHTPTLQIGKGFIKNSSYLLGSFESVLLVTVLLNVLLLQN